LPLVIGDQLFHSLHGRGTAQYLLGCLGCAAAMSATLDGGARAAPGTALAATDRSLVLIYVKVCPAQRLPTPGQRAFAIVTAHHVLLLAPDHLAQFWRQALHAFFREEWHCICDEYSYFAPGG
jgi:hypothetical protein